MASSVQLPGTDLTFVVDSTTCCGQDFPAAGGQESSEIRGGFSKLGGAALTSRPSCEQLKEHFGKSSLLLRDVTQQLIS